MTFPSTIHAFTIAKNGGPEVLEKTEIPFPKVEPGHILVKTEYFGINFIDTYFREGLYPAPHFPYVLGKEAAGAIVGLPTDPAVLNDPEYQKRGYQHGARAALSSSNAHAEYVSVPWKSVSPVPDSVSTRTAVAVLLQGLTAITFMEEAYNVQQGDIILIHTVAGGLGLLLSQFAKSRGATVIGTTSTEEKAALAKRNWNGPLQKVLEVTNGEGVHAVFDGVGKDTFESDFDMLRRKGTLVAVGNASGAIPPFAPLKLSKKNLKLLRPTLDNYVYTPSEATNYTHKLWSLVENGTLRPTVHKEYPFTAQGLREAHIDLTGGKTVGKLVIKVGQ
ncbi:hypothetical protein JVU11DRAFT_4705 [Chiua virens]|nr:hypothetical protein JVU11DRAFT_4705 [Chiua virens]